MKQSSFSADVVQEMASLYTAGLTFQDLADKFYADPKTIRQQILPFITPRPRGPRRKR